MPLSDFFDSMKGMVPAPSNAVPMPQIPNPETTTSPYLRTNLPLPLQYTPDTLKQYNKPGLSSFRIAPLPPGGAPANNSAAGTVTLTSIHEFVTVAAAGPNSAVQFNNGGALAGAANFEWNNVTSTLTIVGTSISTVFNATIGFQIGGLATAGNILLGNGTNFVSSPPVGLSLWNTISESSAYLAIAGDYVEANTSLGGFTVTLPSAAANKNKSIRVKKISSDLNTLTVAAADNIDGLPTQFWTSQFTEMEVTSDGTTWIIG